LVLVGEVLVLVGVWLGWLGSWGSFFGDLGRFLRFFYAKQKIMEEIKQATFYLQVASVSDFIYYDEDRVRHLKHGFHYWELKDDSFFFRTTLSHGSRTAKNTWIEQHLVESLREQKLYVPSATLILSSNSETEKSSLESFIDFGIKHRFTPLSAARKTQLLNDYLNRK
jgi:hypothetical protein